MMGSSNLDAKGATLFDSIWYSYSQLRLFFSNLPLTPTCELYKTYRILCLFGHFFPLTQCYCSLLWRVACVRRRQTCQDNILVDQDEKGVRVREPGHRLRRAGPPWDCWQIMLWMFPWKLLQYIRMETVFVTILYTRTFGFANMVQVRVLWGHGLWFRYDFVHLLIVKWAIRLEDPPPSSIGSLSCIQSFCWTLWLGGGFIWNYTPISSEHHLPVWWVSEYMMYEMGQSKKFWLSKRPMWSVIKEIFLFRLPYMVGRWVRVVLPDFVCCEGPDQLDDILNFNESPINTTSSPYHRNTSSALPKTKSWPLKNSALFPSGHGLFSGAILASGRVFLDVCSTPRYASLIWAQPFLLKHLRVWRWPHPSTCHMRRSFFAVKYQAFFWVGASHPVVTG